MIEISDDFTARGLTVRLGCVEAAVAVGPGGADLIPPDTLDAFETIDLQSGK